jgi:quercetin dioxygenase-like cupin family protein
MSKSRALLAAGAVAMMLALIVPLASSQEEVVKVVPNKEYDPSWMDIGSMLQKVPTVKDSSLQIVPLGDGKNISVGLAQLGPNTRILGHIHKEHDEIAHVVMGSCKLKLGDDLIDFQPGSVVLIPAGVPHGALAGPDGAVVVSCFAPQWDQTDRYRDRRGDP